MNTVFKLKSTIQGLLDRPSTQIY